MNRLTLDDAMVIANGALNKARSIGISISVSIVDDAGRLILSMRGDGTGYLTTDTSLGKARASAAFGKPTLDIVEEVSSSPSLFWSSLSGFSDKVLPSTGAVPVLVDGICVGAIGCGGGTAEQDHSFAQAGARVFCSEVVAQ